MASSNNPASLQPWLNQATDPNNEEERWDSIQAFYELVNNETDGPQVALRLLGHKIQSPQEKEALQALTVLEACMNNCGKRFHTEAVKFRFLNELIKILSPKHLGTWSPQKVKDRVTEVLYGWTLWLKDEPKIQEAYTMLKKQGHVVTDPKLPDKVVMPPLRKRSTESVFDQEDKAKLLSELLKSGRPEDLKTANKLIKNTVREEEEKAEKELKCKSTLKDVQSSIEELRELLQHHTITETPFQPSNDMKAVYERCEQLRPTLYRLASNTENNDTALSQILAANDELTFVVNAYKKHAERAMCNGGRGKSKSEEASSQYHTPKSPRGIKTYNLIDLSDLDSPLIHTNAESPSAFRSSSPHFFSHIDKNIESKAEPALNEFDLLSKPATQSDSMEHRQHDEDFEMNVEQNRGRNVVLRSRGCGQSSATSNGTKPWSFSENQQFSQSVFTSKKETSHVCLMNPEQSSCSPQLLKNVFVPLETIQYSQLKPITVYDDGGIRVSLHFAGHTPQGLPDVAVIVLFAFNMSALQVKDFQFQAAVPKNILVKLQPASATLLPPYNPLLPPPAISQVVLLANPHRSTVRLRYKLTLTHGSQQVDQTDDINSFPDWNSWIGR